GKLLIVPIYQMGRYGKIDYEESAGQAGGLCYRICELLSFPRSAAERFSSSCEVTLPKKLNNIKWIYGHQLRTYNRGGEIRFYRQVPDTP
ncbi:MAG: hypothetical protein WBW79_09150, partial [Desulfocapsaceae bacterium]